jgi:hypothetical protein
VSGSPHARDLGRFLPGEPGSVVTEPPDTMASETWSRPYLIVPHKRGSDLVFSLPRTSAPLLFPLKCLVRR